MVTTMNPFSVILLLSLIYSTTCYKSCKEIAEANCFPENKEYQLEHNGNMLRVFCVFYEDYGYTFIHSNDLDDLNNLSLLEYETDEVMLQILNNNNVQHESLLTQLTNFQSIPLKIHLQIDGTTTFPSDYVEPNITETKYIYVGLVPKNTVITTGANGYAINGEEYAPSAPVNANDGESYFAFKDTSSAAGLTQASYTRRWFTQKQAASVNIPLGYFYKFCEAIACTPLTELEDLGMSPGFRFNYEPKCCPEEVTTVGTRCRPGQCLNVECNDCRSGFSTDGCDAHGPEFKCCRDHPVTCDQCQVFPDPHVITFNGFSNEAQYTGWFLLTRPCHEDWRVYAKFYRTHPWYTLVDRVLVTSGNKYIWIDRHRNAEAGTISGSGAMTNNIPVYSPGIVWLGSGIIYSITSPKSFSHIWINNGDVEVSYNGYTIVIRLKARYMNDLCGCVCGPWTSPRVNEPINNLDCTWNPGLPGENDTTNASEPTNCTFAGTPAGVAYCAAHMNDHVMDCPEIDTEMYREYCQHDYCLDGERGANMTLAVFYDACYPPREASCTICGFRTYKTFDGAEYNFLGCECEYTVAADCTNAPADETWSVKIKQSRGEVEGREAMVIEKVMIHYRGKDIVIVRKPFSLWVDGAKITTKVYADPGHDFVISYYGKMVVFRAVDMVITWNCKQFLKIDLKERWFDKTHGMCGDWNDYRPDDYPEAGLIPAVEEQCYVTSTCGCANEYERHHAKMICLKALQAVHCEDIHPMTQVDRCAEEYCCGKEAYLCEHILGYMDKCYCMNGRPEMLDHKPKACKGKAGKTGKMSKDKIKGSAVIHSVKLH